MRYLGDGFVSFDLVSLSVRTVSQSRLLFTPYSESANKYHCLYRYPDFSLPLGFDDHDISTMVRQLKIIHGNGYGLEERIDSVRPFRRTPSRPPAVLSKSYDVTFGTRDLFKRSAPSLFASGSFRYIMEALICSLGIHCEIFERHCRC